MTDLAEYEATLARRREPYARLTVVWSRQPVSARPGDTAIVTSDGLVHGWVGGSCSEPILVGQALESMRHGTPHLVHLAAPGEEPVPREGEVVIPVTCVSEGSLEVLVEPRLASPNLIAIGRSPLVRALASMASTIGFEVTVVERDDVDPADLSVPVVPVLDLDKAGAGPDSFVVVATMGRYDEDALAAALATGAQYVGLVASARRARAVFGALEATGVAAEVLARVHAPAGLDLGSLRHEEIAVAILADIVRERARARSAAVGGERPTTGGCCAG